MKGLIRLGFFRALDTKYACDGEEMCDHVRQVLGHSGEERLLGELWWVLVVGPLEYVRGG